MDASAVVERLIGDRDHPDVWDEWHSHVGLDLEVVSVLRRSVHRSLLTADSARESLDYLNALRIERHRVTRLVPRIWQLRHDISAYDAGYVALAEALGIPLVTLDHRLARTAGRYCDVVVP